MEMQLGWFEWLTPFLESVSTLPQQAMAQRQPIVLGGGVSSFIGGTFPIQSNPPSWQLAKLESPDWGDLQTATAILEQRYGGAIGTLPPAGLKILLQSYEMLMGAADQARRKPQLELFSSRIDEQGKDRTEAHERAEAQYQNLSDQLAFIKRELTHLNDNQVSLLTAAPELARYAPWIHYIREVERIDPPKELQTTLVQQINTAKEMSEMVESARRNSTDPTALAQQQALMARAMDTAIGTHIELAKARGFYGSGAGGSPVLDYSLAQNQVSKETITALETSGEELIPQLAKIYDKKAALIAPQQATLSMAQLDGELPTQLGRRKSNSFSWEQGKRIAQNFYADLGLGNEVNAIFNEGRIDARPLSIAQGKEATPQVTPISGAKPYVLTLYDGSWENLSNLVHELGHGIHYGLAEDAQTGSPNALYGMQYGMPIPLIETYALFGERLLFEKQVQAMKKEGRSTADITQLKLDFISNRMFFTSQAMGRHGFEKDLHDMKRSGQTLTAESISDAWVKNMAPCYGSRLNVDDPAFRTSWMNGDMQSYFTESPFYGYGYLYASQASDLLYESYKANPEQFRQQWKAMQMEGQQKPMEVLLKEHFGIDLTNAKTLHGTVERTEKFVNELDLSVLAPTKWQDKVRPSAEISGQAVMAR